MTRVPAKIPPWVLIQTLGLVCIVGIPVLFVAINQIRRACGSDLFGTRQHFCSVAEFARWVPTLPGWASILAGVAIISGVLLARRFLRRVTS